MKARPSYKPTFFDRHGPDGVLRIRAAAYALSVLGTILGVCIVRGAPPLVTLVLCLTLPPLTLFGSLWLGNGAGKAMQYLTAGGSSTPGILIGTRRSLKPPDTGRKGPGHVQAFESFGHTDDSFS